MPDFNCVNGVYFFYHIKKAFLCIDECLLKGFWRKFFQYICMKNLAPLKKLYYCNLNHSVSFLNEQKSNLKIMDFKR